jgi:ribonuclease P protein component
VAVTGRRTFATGDRIHHRREFEQLSQNGFKVVNGQFVALVRPHTTGPDSRLGVTVSRKVGNAVARNRIKRLIREFFRLNRRLLVPPCDLNIIARPCTADLPSTPVFNALDALFRQISGDTRSKRSC